MIKPDGSGLREITSGANNNGFPSYAPDGKRFVYRTFGPEGQGLRVMNLEDGHVTKLTEDYDNFPRWSPRGDLIMFVRRLEGSFAIFTIAPDGKRLKRLTRSRQRQFARDVVARRRVDRLCISPDGLQR